MEYLGQLATGAEVLVIASVRPGAPGPCLRPEHGRVSPCATSPEEGRYEAQEHHQHGGPRGEGKADNFGNGHGAAPVAPHHWLTW